MGGRVALNLTEHYLKPELLILISASLGLETKMAQEQRLEQDLNLFKKISESYTLLEFFRDWYSAPMFLPYLKSKNFEKDILDKSTNNYKSWEASLRFFSQGNFPLKKVPTFTYPIHYISGSEDKKYLNSGVTNQMHILRAGHNPHKTHPAELLLKLANILEQ